MTKPTEVNAQYVYVVHGSNHVVNYNGQPSTRHQADLKPQTGQIYEKDTTPPQGKPEDNDT